MIVDNHVHVVSEDRERYPLAPGIEITAWHEHFAVTPEQLLAAMDRAGVAAAVLVQPYGPYSYDNSFHADSAARYPDRFVGVCAVDPLAPDAPDRLSYWVEDRGMRGLRLIASRPGDEWLDAPRTYPLWQRTRELDIPITVLTTAERVPQLQEMARRFPEVPVCLDHLGNWGRRSGAMTEALTRILLEMAAQPNVYLKVSPYGLLTALASAAETELLRQLADRYGAHRMMWGSNYPVSYEEDRSMVLPSLVERAMPFLSADEREWVLSGTTLSLWPQLRGTASPASGQ